MHMKTNRRPLVASDTERISKLCGMFSSDHMGERATAAGIADRFLRDRGWRWVDVINPKEDEFAQFGGWQGAAQHCLRFAGELKDSQRGFCIEILLYSSPNGLTTMQRNRLRKLVDQVGAAYHYRYRQRGRTRRDAG